MQGDEMQVERTELTDGRITMRPHQLKDVRPCFEAAQQSINELSPWMFWCHSGYSIDETKIWIESRPWLWNKGTDYSFAIIDPHERSFLGSCALSHVDPVNRVAELGYWVRTDRSRQGIASAATLLAARFAFEKLALNRVEIVVATGNKASQRVAEKIGAVREGTLRERIVVREAVHDAFMYSLIASDLER
jgi:RimJ/RimL family protein N-acetyltransferase